MRLTEKDKEDYKKLINAIYVIKNMLKKILQSEIIVISQVSTEDQFPKIVILIDKITVFFHNLRGYDSHFIAQVIGDIPKNS